MWQRYVKVFESDLEWGSRVLRHPFLLDFEYTLKKLKLRGYIIHQEHLRSLGRHRYGVLLLKLANGYNTWILFVTSSYSSLYPHLHLHLYLDVNNLPNLLDPSLDTSKEFQCLPSCFFNLLTLPNQFSPLVDGSIESLSRIESNQSQYFT
jgi:hypothetical protein